MSEKTRRRVDPGIVLALGLVALLVAARLFLFQFFTVPSGAMEPTVYPGDYLVASKFAYAPILGHSPRRGDLVFFWQMRGDKRIVFLKRLIGLPGERIQLKQGAVYVNGAVLPRQALAGGTEIGPFGLVHPVSRFRETMPDGKSYVVNSYGPDGDADNTGVYVVPDGRYFFLGDNRDNSADSRFPEGLGNGYVPLDHFIARADLAISTHAKDGRPNDLIRRLN
jgi:signal peptidase I